MKTAVRRFLRSRQRTHRLASANAADVADVANGSNTVKQPGTAKSVAEHVKAGVAEATDSKGGDSAK